jgi:uncharacterized lipoprotein
MNGSGKISLVLIVSAVALLTACKEQWETEDYQAGYEAGYEDARHAICRDWKLNLPGDLYGRYMPRECR